MSLHSFITPYVSDPLSRQYTFTRHQSVIYTSKSGLCASVPVPWTSHICACSLCNATHKFCASFQQKNSSCIHLTLDPCTGLLMQPRFSEENYATQFVRQRLVALFWSFQPFLSIFQVPKCVVTKKPNLVTIWAHFLRCVTVWNMYDSYRQGQKGTFRCFCQKVFSLPSVPICWPSSYCAWFI